ncbi:hypothetical protein [Nocardioides taihuensis]|uniref:Uncharacterized protein n=1 Tax=Nocardioides taihuensis TaxID=1835606 RepID=A0ABW0BMV3_9ACTN
MTTTTATAAPAPDATDLPQTAPALRPPTWPGRKPAVSASLARPPQEGR